MPVQPGVCRIVARPERGARVLVDLLGLDMADRSGSFLGPADGFKLGDPELPRRGALEEEATRTITVPLRIINESLALNRAIAEVSAALAAPSPWLEFAKTDRDPSTYFRLRGGNTGDIDWASVRDDDAHYVEWNLTLLADAFGLGERETVFEGRIGSGSGYRDKVSVTLGEVRGSLPSPAIVTATPSKSWLGWTQWYGITPVLDASTTGGPVMIFPGDTGMNATGGATVNTGGWLELPTGANKAQVLWGYPKVKIPAGQYQVFIKAGKATGTPGNATFWFGSAAGILGRPRAVNFSAGFQDRSWVQMGTYSWPAGMDVTDIEDGLQEPGLYVRATTDSGTPLQVWAILLVPADLANSVGATSGMSTHWRPESTSYPDGQHSPAPYAAEIKGRVVGVRAQNLWTTHPPIVGGGPLMLTPGVDNVLTVLHRINPGSTAPTADLMDLMSIDVRVEHQPRWLHLAAL